MTSVEEKGSAVDPEEESDEVTVPDMELDFHIQFPTSSYDKKVTSAGDPAEGDTSRPEKIWPIPGYVDKEGDDKYEGKEVVVVLLGWAGAEHKHLQKYSDIYLKRGCIVLRYIAPVKSLFVQTRKLPVLAHRLIRLIQDLQLESHPIFFQVFSNGGSFLYASVLSELAKMQHKGNLKWDIRGTIFDSAPTPRNLAKCFNAVTSIFGSMGMFKYFIASLIVLMIIFQVFYLHLKSAITLCVFGEQLNSLDPVKYKVEEIPMKNWLGKICKMQNHNFLFLYSDNDDLIPWTLVEEIADIAATQQGNHVEKKKFLGSVHVQHYRQYPNEYLEAVTDFVRLCMKSKKPTTVFWYGV